MGYNLDSIELIKLSLKEDVATLNNAHSINMDVIERFVVSLIGCLDNIEQDIINVTPTTQPLKRYVYTLDISLVDGVTSTLSDGTTVTKTGLVFTIVHFTDLTNVLHPTIMDENGGLITSDINISVNLTNPNVITITLPVTLPSNIKLVFIN